MAATSRTVNYDALLTTTADKIHKSGAIQDAITNSNPTFKALYEAGKVKKMDVGGDLIKVALMYQHNGTISSYSDYDQIDISPQDGITSAFVPWAQYAGAVSISGIQKFKNMGPEKIADLLKSKITQTTAGWSEKLNRDLLDHTGRSTSSPAYSANGGKNIIGLPLWIMDATDNAASTYQPGMIDRSSESWFRNQVEDTASTSWLLLNNNMRSLYNNCSQGPGGKPDLIIADQVSYEAYEAGMNENVRYSFKDMASVGFENVAFKGAKVFWDGYVPDVANDANGVLATGSALTEGTMYFLNTNTFTMYVGKGHDFAPRGFQTPVDQDASTSLYLAYVQLVCDNPRKNGVHYNIGASIVN